MPSAFHTMSKYFYCKIACRIVVKYRTATAKCIEVHPSIFPNRITREPTAESGGIVALAVVIKAGLAVEELGRVTKREDIGKRTGLRDGSAEGVVGVGGDDIPGGIAVTDDVAVGRVFNRLIAAMFDTDHLSVLYQNAGTNDSIVRHATAQPHIIMNEHIKSIAREHQ